MQDDSARVGDALPGQIAVSPNNPCPFLRALVASGLLRDHIVPVRKLCGVVEAATAATGSSKMLLGIGAFLVITIANGLRPSRLLRNLLFGAELDQLRNGPLDKQGGGSRILDTEANVHEGEIDRLAGFGSDRLDLTGRSERGLNAEQIETYLRANLERDVPNRRRKYSILMHGEWSLMMRAMGKGSGAERYLSVSEVRTMFVERIGRDTNFYWIVPR